MDPQFEELARQIATEVIEQFEVQFKRQLHEFEGRFEAMMQVHSESIKNVLNNAAEGHARTVESIHHTLDRLEKIVDKFGDHDSILVQHNQRISTLEKNRSN